MTGTGTSAERVRAGQGQRHAWNDKLCGYLERVLRGESARRYLDGEHGPLPRRAAAVALPSWQWSHAGDAVGRKALGANGTALLMPIRVAWEPGPVVVVASGTEVTASWRALGLGHTMMGSSVVRASAIEARESDAEPEPVPSGLFTGRAGPRARVERQLRDWVTDGEQARWEALLSLESYVRKSCTKAASAIAHDFKGYASRLGVSDRGWRVIGDTTIDTVVSRMLFGDEDSDREGPVAKLLTRCLVPGKFLRTDPMHYVTISLRRDAEQEMRRLLDDPRIGFKVRRLHAALPECSTMDELLEQYRLRFPADRLAKRRAAKALTPSPDPMADPAVLYPESVSDDYFDLDQVLGLNDSSEGELDEPGRAVGDLIDLPVDREHPTRRNVA